MWEMREDSRRSPGLPEPPSTSEDLHAWSIYRQNLNSDFTDSALGSQEKSPLPYGNFHLREHTMASILTNPKYGPKSELGGNAYTYLKFGLPRVLPPRPGGGSSVGTPGPGSGGEGGRRSRGRRRHMDNSSGYDSTDEEEFSPATRARSVPPGQLMRPAKSQENILSRSTQHLNQRNPYFPSNRNQDTRKLRAVSEADLLRYPPESDVEDVPRRRPRSRSRASRRSASQDDVLRSVVDGNSKNHLLSESSDPEQNPAMFVGRLGGRNEPKLRHKTASQLSVARQREGLSYRHDAPILNDMFSPKDPYDAVDINGFSAGGNHNPHFSEDYKMDTFESNIADGGVFKYPHLQLRNVSYDVKNGSRWERVLDGINIEAKGGEIIAIMATNRKNFFFFPIDTNSQQ